MSCNCVYCEYIWVVWWILSFNAWPHKVKRVGKVKRPLYFFYCLKMEKTTWSITREWDWFIEESYLFTYSEEERQENEINKENAKLVFSPKFIPLYTELLEYMTMVEALIYGFMDFYLSKWSGRFYFTNWQLAEMLKCSESSITKAIKKLQELELIKAKRKIKSWWWQIRFIELYKNKNHLVNFTSLSSKKVATNKNKINNNKNYKNIHQNKFDALFSFYWLSKKNIEERFEKKKTLQEIMDCCEAIQEVAQKINVPPIYDRETINCFHITLKEYSLCDIDNLIEDEWLPYDDFHDFIRCDYYLPYRLSMM